MNKENVKAKCHRCEMLIFKKLEHPEMGDTPFETTKVYFDNEKPYCLTCFNKIKNSKK